MIVLLQHLTAAQADTYSLVLSAEGIAHRLIKSQTDWSVVVSAEDYGRAIADIEAYRRENPETPVAGDGTEIRIRRQTSW